MLLYRAPMGPPVAQDDNYIGYRDSTIVLAVLDNDSDPESRLDTSSVTITIQPPNGTAVANPDVAVTVST